MSRLIWRLMVNARHMIVVCSVAVSILCVAPANAMGSGDKFVDAQVGLTYGVYKPTNTIGLRLHMFQLLVCQPGMEQWVATSYGFGKKKIDVYETMAGDRCSDPGLAKELPSTMINGVTAQVFVYCEPMNPKVFKACSAQDISKVGGYLKFVPNPKLNYRSTEIQIQGVGGVTFQQLRTVAASLI